MIPVGGQIVPEHNQAINRRPSLTWKLDFMRGRIMGMIDDLEAVRQAVLKALQTERFAFLIYSFHYGNELHRLVGMSSLYVRSEVSRMIREALSMDDRIWAIENVDIKVNGDSMMISFAVVTQYGTFQASREVRM